MVKRCECGHTIERHNKKGICQGSITDGLFLMSYPCSCTKVRPAPPPLHFKETQYGFEYGAAKINRLFSDTKKGWVCIGIDTPKNEKTKQQGYQIFVTKSGKVRICQPGGKEMK